MPSAPSSYPGQDGGIVEADQVVIGATGETLENTIATLPLGAANRILRLLDNNQSAALLVLGDSTGNATTEWVYLVTTALAVRYPTHNVKYYLWPSTEASAYDAAVDIQVVPGGPTLSVYNCSVSGMAPQFHMGATRAASQIDVSNADLVIVNHGHNLTLNTTINPIGPLLGLYAEVMDRLPGAGLMTVLQNPQTTTGAENTVTSDKIPYIHTAAAAFGVEVIDVWSALRKVNGFAAHVADGIHPDATLMAVWANEALKHLRYGPGQATRGGFVNSPSLIKNSNFEDWSGADPADWTLSGTVTTAKETTNKETGSWALKLTAVATSDRLFQTITGNGLAALKGWFITFAARIRNATFATTGNGRIQLSFSGSRSISLNNPGDYSGEYRWIVVSGLVPDDTTFVTFNLYPDTSTAGQFAYYDRVWVGRGARVGDSVTLY